MDTNRHNLSARQRRAITVIISSRTISSGVSLAGISLATFYNWLQDSTFKDEFEKQKKAVIDLALHELKIGAEEAVHVLRRLLKAKSESIRLRASISIIDYIAKFIELEEIERRLSLVEESHDQSEK